MTRTVNNLRTNSYKSDKNDKNGENVTYKLF